MHRIKNNLKTTLPTPLYSFLQESYDTVCRLPDWPAATFHPWRRDSIKRLRKLKNIHQGEHCFLIGNGPSLRKTDLSRLQNEFAIPLILAKASAGSCLTWRAGSGLINWQNYIRRKPAGRYWTQR